MSFTVSVMGGDNETMKSGVKSAVEEYCQQIRNELTAIPTDEEREKINKEAVDRLGAAYPQYNVMVVHPEHSKNLEECTHVQLKVMLGGDERNFQVYVFKRGDFTLEGDGGYINWCFAGNFERDDKKVTFSDR